jgi:hypothetical protein
MLAQDKRSAVLGKRPKQITSPGRGAGDHSHCWPFIRSNPSAAKGTPPVSIASGLSVIHPQLV